MHTLYVGKRHTHLKQAAAMHVQTQHAAYTSMSGRAAMASARRRAFMLRERSININCRSGPATFLRKYKVDSGWVYAINNTCTRSGRTTSDDLCGYSSVLR